MMPPGGHEKLQLSIMAGHVDEAIRAFDLFDLGVTNLEEEFVLEPLRLAREKIADLISHQDREMEVGYFNALLDERDGVGRG